VDMKSVSKGFLTTIFSNLDDRDNVFENVPYLFNLASFYLILWTKKFILVKEDFIVA
jgi:hypothetical protein